MKKMILPLVIASILFACSTELTEKKGEIESTITAGAQSDKELQKELEIIRKEEAARLKEIEESSTKVEFDRVFHDFGDVGPDTDNITEFLVKNVGNKPLIIENVSASCGCTMPKKPEKPIPPGKSDVIEVKFHPKPDQVNEIKKSITVTANTDPKVSLLEIRAFVKKK